MIQYIPRRIWVQNFARWFNITKCFVFDVVFWDTKVVVNGGGSGLTSSADTEGHVCRFPHGYAWKFLMTLTASRHSGVIKMSTTMCSSLLDLYGYILTSDGYEHLASRLGYWSINCSNQESTYFYKWKELYNMRYYKNEYTYIEDFF